MFNAPLSQDRAQHLITSLELSTGASVVDLGCGNGLFLETLALQHPIKGVGIDKDSDLIQNAKDKWGQQTSKSDLQFVCADVNDYIGDMPASDVIICIGAEYMFGGYRELLQQAKQHLKPNGILLIGTIYWKQTPADEYLAIMGGKNPNFDLYTTVQLAYDAGFIPLDVQRSNDDEWDTFESRSSRKHYQTAIKNNDTVLRQQTWDWQAGYLKWGMTTMGFCYLILQKI